MGLETGITDEIIQSFGTVSIDIFFHEIILSHKFHVVPDDFNIPSDGIIGKDFNRRFKCVIDYGDMIFTIRAPEHNVYLKKKIQSRKIITRRWQHAAKHIAFST